MVYKKFVQIGGIVYIALGYEAGKIAAIVNVVDQNRLLIDGPCTGVKRQVINIKRIQLTKFHINIPQQCKADLVKKQWTKDNITSRWQNTAWFKNIARKEKKESLTEFERFKARILMGKRNAIINEELIKIAKKDKKSKLLCKIGKKYHIAETRRALKKKLKAKKAAEAKKSATA